MYQWVWALGSNRRFLTNEALSLQMHALSLLSNSIPWLTCWNLVHSFSYFKFHFIWHGLQLQLDRILIWFTKTWLFGRFSLTIARISPIRFNESDSFWHWLRQIRSPLCSAVLCRSSTLEKNCARYNQEQNYYMIDKTIFQNVGVHKLHVPYYFESSHQNCHVLNSYKTLTYSGPL